MVEPTFDRALYESQTHTRWIGRELMTCAEVDSTNDVAWEALGHDAPDGLVVVSDVQRRGRGRSGRAWHTAPGSGLALSLLLHRGCERRPLSVLPLAAGLALARAFDRLSVPARLKWPNDLLVGLRKVAGILVESRGGTRDRERRAVVIGVGVNVAQSASDFPVELRVGAEGLPATSLAIEGCAIGREGVAAAFVNAFEPLWVDLERRGAAPLLEAWTERASFWGETVRASTAAGVVTGIARGLDATGALVLERPGGELLQVWAGDVTPADAPLPARR